MNRRLLLLAIPAAIFLARSRSRRAMRDQAAGAGFGRARFGPGGHRGFLRGAGAGHGFGRRRGTPETWDLDAGDREAAAWTAV